MTIEAFPIRVNKRTVASPPRQHIFGAVTARELVLLSVVLNVCTLVLIANLSRVLLAALQP
jgi:hypothetical protein